MPGYVLQRIIGSGGYGEVWKASAPGDLVKAVKIIYGGVQDRCALRELKSLNRVKTVQHPFLLSIERIEVVDNRLLIVTEFAESCLKRRFLACRQDGLPGIPRRELIGYLADAADALDFIRNNFRLQHLDVKPENLLLNGGHIKVADFGLIKDLEETNVSLVAGLTPLYAPPELFDGRPDMNSDQYSLAVVYQEMLTGVPPFTGRTAAQLAAQHLKSPPVLTTLPLADQPVIAKALAKEPGRRFGSCSEMVEALRTASGTGSTSRLITTGSTGTPVVAPLEDLPVEEDRTRLLHTGKLVKLCDLPAPESGGAEGDHADSGRRPKPRPTLVVGLGGLGTRVLQELRARVQVGCGPSEDTPWLQLLAIDTDAGSLASACRGTAASTLLDQQTLNIPLRTTADYRRHSSKLLNWINRRWLFNIPRSLRTESIRPLGRLALVDHWSRVVERLRFALMSAVNSPDTTTSPPEQTLKLAAPVGPRVFVIAATTGGSGSGMIADVAYGIRSLLDELGLPPDDLCGILVHTPGRSSQGHDIAAANSYVCLKEIEHYSAPGSGYPGDPQNGMEARWTDHATFSHLYFTYLHQSTNGLGQLAGVNQLAEYIFRAIAGNSAEYLDRARTAEIQLHGLSLARRQVRSFGLVSLSSQQDQSLDRQADQLCYRLWSMLLGTPASTSPGQSPRGAMSTSSDDGRAEAGDPRAAMRRRHPCDVWMRQLDLETNYWAEATRQIADRHFGGQSGECLRLLAMNSVENGAAQSAGDLSSSYWEDTFTHFDALMGLTRLTLAQPAGQRSLLESLHTELTEPTKSRCLQIKQTLEGLIDDPQEDLLEVRLLGQAAISHISGLRRTLEEEARAAAMIAENFRTSWLSGGRWTERPKQLADEEWQESLVHQLAAYLDQRVAQVWRRSVASCLLQMENVISDLLERLRLSLSQLCNRYGDRVNGISPADSTSGDASAQTRNVHRLWQRVRERCQQAQHPLTRILLTNGRELDWLAGEAEVIARRWVNAEWRIEVDGQPRDATATCSPERIAQLISDSLPLVAHCGGAVRFLLCGPAGADRTALAKLLAEQLDGPVVEIDESAGPTVLCCELEQAPLRNVTASLIGSRNELLDVAGRLTTRTDVDWEFLK